MLPSKTPVIFVSHNREKEQLMCLIVNGSPALPLASLLPREGTAVRMVISPAPFDVVLERDNCRRKSRTQYCGKFLMPSVKSIRTSPLSGTVISFSSAGNRSCQAFNLYLPGGTSKIL